MGREGADFHTLEVALSQSRTTQYDGAVQWWFKAKEEISDALQKVDMSGNMIWRLFYSAQQRFFKERHGDRVLYNELRIHVWNIVFVGGE